MPTYGAMFSSWFTSNWLLICERRHRVTFLPLYWLYETVCQQKGEKKQFQWITPPAVKKSLLQTAPRGTLPFKNDSSCYSGNDDYAALKLCGRRFLWKCVYVQWWKICRKVHFNEASYSHLSFDAIQASCPLYIGWIRKKPQPGIAPVTSHFVTHCK